MSKPWRPLESSGDSPAITLTKTDDSLIMKQGDQTIIFKGMQSAYLVHSLFEAGRYEEEDNVCN